MITELTRLCTSCRATLPEPPAPPACARCGTVHVPQIAGWDPRLAFFLSAAFTSRGAFHGHYSAQAAHEFLLRQVFNFAGRGTIGHPFGSLGLSAESPAVAIYPHAVKMAAHWRAIGAPLQHDLLLRIGAETGLIPSTHPLLKRAS
jgi:hypothetical protein